MLERQSEPSPDKGGHHFRAGDGVRWSVCEKRPPNRTPALYFESDAAFRRVTEYPVEWQELTAVELERLSHRR